MGTERDRSRQAVFGGRTSCWLVGIAVAGFLAAGPLRAQVASTPSAAAAPASEAATPQELPGEKPITAETIEALRKQAEETADLDEETKKKIAEYYRGATEALQRAQDFAQKAAQYKQDADTAEQRKTAFEAHKSEVEAQKPSLPAGASLEELEQQRATLETRISEAKRAKTAAEEELTNRPDRKGQLLTTLQTIQPRRDENDRQLAAAAPPDEPALLTQARHTELRARRLALDQERPALENEVAKHEKEEAVRLLRLRSDVASAELDFAEKQKKLMETRIAQLRDEQARAALRKAEEEEREIRSQPLLREYAETNTGWAQDARELTGQIDATTKATRKVELSLEDIQSKFKQARDRVDKVGLTHSVGLMLRQQKRSLPDVSTSRSNIRDRRKVVDELRFELFDRNEQRANLPTAPQLVNERLRAADPAEAAVDRQQLELAAEKAIQSRREILDTLLANMNTYLNALIALDISEQQLVNSTDEFIQYIDERVLGIRSDKPFSEGISFSDFAREELWLVTPSEWIQVARAGWQDVVDNPDLFAAAIVVFGILLAMQRRFRSAIIEAGPLAGRKTCTEFRLTVRVAVLTFLISAFWPAVTAYVAWRLAASAPDSPFVSAVAQALWLQMIAFFPLEVLRQVCRRNGLAESHFDWPASAVRTLRVNLRALMVVGMPLFFIIVTLLAAGQKTSHTLERLFFIAATGAVALFLARVLHPSSGVLREYLAYNQDGWIDRLKYVWYWLLVAAPLSLAAISFFGFHYTALVVTVRLFDTFCFLVALIVVRSILLRWLLVNRRRLSIQQARERRAAAIAAQTSAGAVDSTEQSIVVPVEQLANLADLSIQTQRLLTTCVLVASLIGVWSIWEDVFPAFNILDRWPLWTTVEQVSETTTSESGETQIRTRDEIRDITPANLLLAVFVGSIAWIAFRNIPGLLEMSLLQRLPLEPSVRYAITTLASYTIILLGLVMVASTVGLRWSQIQWLGTALMFGLGFGMQEIFANFVAGLIILFERPIRVGDVVTVDDITGVVSRVRIRATTITNWDRKEYVVPNREFITGRLLNWTLSDKVNRIVVNVGVAYGSDTERARDLLQQIANEHPLLLDNPAPVATFEGFGDSTLNLVLCAYLPNMDNRLATIHDLHTEINKRFAAAGLEIAFPQLDLHVRTLAPAADQKGTSPPGPATEASGGS